jgi:hypothetical protein
MLTGAMRTLLSGLVDYAGLFPPAKLAMGPATENYARDRAGERAWMLGRFVCPVSRLKELSLAAGALMPGTLGTSGYREHADAGEPWRISALIDVPDAEGLRRDMDTIAAFNEHHRNEAHGLAAVDSAELKVGRIDFVDEAAELLPDEIYPFFEAAPGQDPRGMIAALAGNQAGAKLRTGGVTPDAFPSPDAIATFVLSCHAAGVPFKATAGLHHPLRSEQRLTYEKDSPKATMHGFLNVFVAAILVDAGRIEPKRVADVIRETDASAFSFTEAGISWRGIGVDTAAVAKAREGFALSFGSCSFEEPCEDLVKLRWA